MTAGTMPRRKTRDPSCRLARPEAPFAGDSSYSEENTMTPPPSGLANAAGSSGQEMVAASAISQVSSTRCQARTRLYRDGRLELEGFPVADISGYLANESVTIWLDLRDPEHDDLAVLSEEFGLHPLAVEAVMRRGQRPKVDRYRSHLFLIAYDARLDTSTGELVTSEIAAFITSQALIAVRKDDGLDIGEVIAHWDENPDLAKFGVGYLLYGLLDHIIDGQFEAVQSLDDYMEELDDRLFDEIPWGLQVQRRSFQLRKSLVLLRRIVNPMSQVVGELMRHDLRIVGDDLMPYYQDVYDQALHAAEQTDSLRDLVSSILATNLTIQGNRMNVITKKVTGWAAIIAVPTLITGFYPGGRAVRTNNARLQGSRRSRGLSTTRRSTPP
jgi:magnesium transporter